MKSVYVTVGTTFFDELIEVVSSSEFISALLSHGYSRMLIQKGKGKRPSQVQEEEEGAKEKKNLSNFTLSYYDYKPSLKEDMQNADLIISHCGAGCLMESLALKKPVVAVVNDTLQGNHQLELAESLDDLGVIIKTDHKKILKDVKDEKFLERVGNLKMLEKPKTEKFAEFVYDVMGINDD